MVKEEGQNLDKTTRHMAILATLISCQVIDTFRLMLPKAFDVKLTPVMVKEVVYQAVDYLGLGRALPFLDAVNECLAAHGIELPIEKLATTTLENRLEKGVEAQVAIFGEPMKEVVTNGCYCSKANRHNLVQWNSECGYRRNS